MIPTRPPNSKSPSPFNSPLFTAPHTPIKFSIIITVMIHSSIQFPNKIEVLILLFTFFQFYSVLSRYRKVDNFASSLFLLLITIRSGPLAEIRWSVCMSTSHRRLCALFSRIAEGCYIYHLFIWWNLNVFCIAQWTTLPTQSYLVLYSFCANLLHSFIMRLFVLSLSLHSLHLLFCWVLSILALIWLVLMALSCAAIRRDSFSLLRFSFSKPGPDFSCDIGLISRFKWPYSFFPIFVS